jgi:hypothetical protein
MERVHIATEKPFSEVRFVAVALKPIDETQRHIGLLHRGDDRHEPMMLHLAWHLDLRNEPARADYVWVDPTIHERRAKQVAAFCRRVWRQNGKSIPYAFSHPNDCFDPTTAQFLFGKTKLGLTCATFVLAVFHAVGLQLLDLDSWPTRPDDVEWQRNVLGLLSERGASADHLRSVEAEPRAARFRPEETGGAAAHRPWPVPFAVAAEVGRQIVALMAVLKHPDEPVA